MFSALGSLSDKHNCYSGIPQLTVSNDLSYLVTRKRIINVTSIYGFVDKYLMVIRHLYKVVPVALILMVITDKHLMHGEILRLIDLG